MYSFLDQGADAYAVWAASDQSRFSKVEEIGKTFDKYQRPESRRPFEKSSSGVSRGFRMDRYHYFEVI